MIPRPLPPALCLLAAVSASAGEPPALHCRGHEPSWSLRIDGPSAALATLDARGAASALLKGTFGAGGGEDLLVWRGRESGATGDVVAMISREACRDTMADAAEGGGTLPYTARVSLVGGEVRQGCCSALALPTPAAAPPASDAAASAAGTARAVEGEISGLVLREADVCRRAARDAVPVDGRQILYDCGEQGVDRVAVVAPLAPGPVGLLQAQRAEIAWNEGAFYVRKVTATVARAAEITLSDGAICREAGPGATLAFEGRRASFTCGTKDGDTVALLGELEPVAGGFRIDRARIAHGDAAGFTLRSPEPVLVRAPR